jgi:hypothetical protein
MTHKLKILPNHLYDITKHGKRFEIRKNDRNFQVGDTVCLNEWTPENEYSGRIFNCKITYVFHGGEYGLDKDYCVFGFEII